MILLSQWYSIKRMIFHTYSITMNIQAYLKMALQSIGVFVLFQ